MNNSNSILTGDQRNKLKKNLEHGAISEIAKIANIDRMTVHRWFANKSHNPVVQKVVVEYIEARDNKITDSLNQIS